MQVQAEDEGLVGLLVAAAHTLTQRELQGELLAELRDVTGDGPDKGLGLSWRGYGGGMEGVWGVRARVTGDKGVGGMERVWRGYH